MQTKKILLSFAAVTIVGALLLNSCKKEESSTTTSGGNTTSPASSATQTQKANDDSQVESYSNSAFDDANTALGKHSSMNGKKEGIDDVCGATVDTSQLSSKIIFLNFDGTTLCGNGTIKRAGQIKLQLTSGTHWKDVGAVLTVTFNDYKVTKVSDEKWVKFNGASTVKNTSGGTPLGMLITGDTLVHQVRMNNMTVTFDDNKTATWSGAWRRDLSGAMQGLIYVITVSIEGDTTLNSVEHTESWGTTRDGDPFTTTLFPAVVFNTVCWNKAISGVKAITVTNSTIGVFALTITCGVNSDGTTCTSGCPYGLKLNWTDLQSTAQQLVIAYQ